jgi:hypothetical protein
MLSLHYLISWPLTSSIMLILTNRLSTNTVIGHLWTTGFGNGDLKTPLFEDVVPTLEAWKAAGKVLAIFSSGSVQAQLQFFSYVQDGQSTRDIKHLFSAHYDTVNAGPKLEKTSYEKICRELGRDVSKVSFLTDNVKGMLHVPISGYSVYETPHPHLVITPYHVTDMVYYTIMSLCPLPLTPSFHICIRRAPVFSSWRKLPQSWRSFHLLTNTGPRILPFYYRSCLLM